MKYWEIIADRLHAEAALSLLFVAVGLCGCGVAYEQNRSEILRSASTEAFGPPPPANYRADGEALIKRLLKDPENARFEWVGKPRREAIQPVFASAHATPVWITNVRVKAKNDLGGFTGFESLFALAWKNGKIVAYTSSTLGIWEYVQSGVGAFGYSLASNCASNRFILRPF
jgi:hypothetical protein